VWGGTGVNTPNVVATGSALNLRALSGDVNISATGNITSNAYLNLSNSANSQGIGGRMTYNTSLQSIDFTFS
jgi:hypothetical protein